MPRRSWKTNARAVSRRKRWRVEDGRAVMEALHESGLKLAEFAEETGIHPERVRRWERRLRGQGEVVPLMPVRVSASAGEMARPSVGELDVIIGGRRVRVGRDFDASTLARLVETLEAVGC